VLELDRTTTLRLFVPNEVLEVEQIAGDSFDPVTSMRQPHILTIQHRPALRPGDMVNLELNLPVLED